MKLDEKAINPSTGLYSYNPQHRKEAEEASDQTELYKALKGAGRQPQTETLRYEDEEDVREGKVPFSGITKIKEMDSDQIHGLCKALMRFRPNIFRLKIKLGNYPSAYETETPTSRSMASTIRRLPTEAAAKIADALADRSVNIVELRYNVTHSSPGYFSTTGEIYVTNAEEYNNEALFNPTIEVTYY